MVEEQNNRGRSPNRGNNPAARSYAARSGGAALSNQLSGEPNQQLSQSFVNPSTGGLTVTEEIFPSLIQTQVQKYQEFMGGADVFVPEVILERPRSRLNALEVLRDEVIGLNDEIKRKQEYILRRIHENVYNEDTDEGYLEIDVRQYDKCYHIDFDGIKACLDEEVDRLRNELRKAQSDADNLVQKMQTFLKQNHKIVQDFLKTSHKAVYNMAKPAKHRANITVGDSLTLQSHDTAEPSVWQPTLVQMPAFGLENQYHSEWPSMNQLKRLNLTKTIKLTQIELGYTTSLYQVKLHFTGEVSSQIIGVDAPKSQSKGTSKKFNIESDCRIADLYINQHDQVGGDIYGLRILDETGNYLVNEHWTNKGGQGSWKHFKIPSGKEIVGLHATHDRESIKSFGLTLWKPNEAAVPNTVAPGTKASHRSAVTNESF